MRISRKAEYALRALVALAGNGRPLQIGELSRLENIPVKFLEQILLILRNAGVLTSKRGVGGGYTLRRKPGEITVGEVVRVLDGPVALAPSAGDEGGNPGPVHVFMKELDEQINALLDGRTIEDLAKLRGAHSLAFDI